MKKKKRVILADNLLFYICCILILILLITLILGGYMYSFFNKTVYSDFLAGNRQNVVAIAGRHENDLQIVEDIVTQLNLSKDITDFYLEDEPIKGAKLISRLKQYVEVSQFFSVILYQNHKDKYIFSSSTSFATKHFLEKGCLLEEVKPDQLEAMLLSERPLLSILPEQKAGGWLLDSYIIDTNKTFFFQAIPPEYDETVVFIVAESYYDKLLQGQENEASTGFLYYDDRVIVTRGNLDIAVEQLNQLMMQNGGSSSGAGLECKQKIVDISGEEYLLSIQKGDSNICYGTLRSMNDFYEKVKPDQWRMILLVSGCLGVIVVLFLFCSGKLLKKIQSISLLLEQEEYYKLNNVEEGIRSLIALQEETKLENLIQKKAIFVRNFMRGDYRSREAVMEAAYRVELDVDYQNYMIVIVRNRRQHSENKVLEDFLEVLQQEEDVSGYGARLINNNRNVFAVFGDNSDAIEHVLKKFLEIEKEYEQDYIIAVSQCHTDFTEGAKAYLEAEMAYDNHLLLDNSRIIRFSEMLQVDYSNVPVDNYVKQLRYALKIGDLSATEAAIHGICGRLKQEKVSLYAFRMLYLDIIHILLKEWNDKEIQLERFYNVFTLSQCMSVQDFYKLLYEICQTIVESKMEQVSVEQGIVEDAIDYMENHYQDPNLTINALVEYLGVNAVVLQSEFRKTMDLRPSDYLRNLRMEKAKDLLRTTDMAVKEISLAVGYEDDHVLRRWFKDYTGKTPKQYRNEYFMNKE